MKVGERVQSSVTDFQGNTHCHSRKELFLINYIPEELATGANCTLVLWERGLLEYTLQGDRGQRVTGHRSQVTDKA